MKKLHLDQSCNIVDFLKGLHIAQDVYFLTKSPKKDLISCVIESTNEEAFVLINNVWTEKSR